MVSRIFFQIFLFLTFSYIAFAKDQLPVTVYSLGDQKFEIVKIKDKELSKDCEKNAKCLALTKQTEKIAEDNTAKKIADHPASRFCLTAGGGNLILKSNSGDEYDFCQFKDKSLINSWDFYYAHFPKTFAK